MHNDTVLPPALPSSTPPQAKVATAAGAAVANVLGMLIELAVVGGAIWLRSINMLSEDHLMYAGAALIGPGVARIRGTPSASSLVTLAVVLPWLLKKSAIAG